MTPREKIKFAIHAHRIADGSRYDETLNTVEKAIDEAIDDTIRARSITAARAPTPAGWTLIEDRIEVFRSKVAARAEGRDYCGVATNMADLRRARDGILDAVRALPDRREWIATAALQGLLASDAGWQVGCAETAAAAVRQADALIAALDAKEPTP